jgi:peptide/nickel transport system substrate-binding protein
MGIKEVAVIDDYTVEVRLVQPWPDFFAQWVSYRPGFIINKKAIEELGNRYTASPVGTGAYVLERLSPREEVVLRRNPRYYGQAPYFDVLRYKIVLDLNVLAIGLQKGDVEIMYATDPAVSTRLLNMKDVEKVRYTSDRTHYLWMNNKKYPFMDRRIRQAFWWGLNREEIVKAAWEGMATVTDTTSPFKDPNTLKGRVYTYNPERAKQLLDQAGYDYNTRIPLAMTPGEEEVVGPLLQAQYGRIGIRIDLVPMERLERVRQMATGQATLWHGARLRFLAAQQLEPYNAQWDRYDIGEEWRQRLQRAIAERDPRKRRELYHSLQRYLLVEAPQIPLYYPDWVLAWRPDLTGIVPGIGTFRIPEDTIRRR